MSSYVKFCLSLQPNDRFRPEKLGIGRNCFQCRKSSLPSGALRYTRIPMDKTLQVREILATRGLTLYQISQRSAELFGRSSPFYIPHNWYYGLARTLSIATIYQLLAMSHITNFRLSDWLAVFGFDLDAIFGLQFRLPRGYTAVLDSTVHDTNAWIRWFADASQSGPAAPIAPLGQLLTRASSKRVADVLALNRRRFRYAVIGELDAYAIPYFVPGSVVRVDPRRVEGALSRSDASRAGTFFLVEHSLGWTCSRLIPVGKDLVVLHSPQQPCAERELHTGKDASIIGVIDAEIRLMARNRFPKGMVAQPPAQGRPRIEHRLEERASLGSLLRHSRKRAGLTFREASSLSRLVAELLSDELYFAAPSTLSDYETLSEPPRHIQKVITLCLLYCLSFEQFLGASKLPLERTGHEPMPDAITGRESAVGIHSREIAGNNGRLEPKGFLASLLDEWEEVPLFLRWSLKEVTGLKDFSLSDLFWIGGDKLQAHPLLVDASFVVINRRARRPRPSDGDRLCDQPFYLVLKRDGGYLCGRCSLDGENLTVHGYPRGHIGAQQFKEGSDAEIVGQVTAILRRLL